MLPATTRRSLGLMLGAWLLVPVLSTPTIASPDDDPPKLAGTWTWKWKDAQGETHTHTLEVEGEGAKMVARERFDDQEAIKVDKIKLEGKKVNITIERKDRRSVYTGTVEGKDTINGMVSVTTEGQPASEFGWTASREAGGKDKKEEKKPGT